MNERIEQLAEQCWVHTNEPLFAAKSPHWEFDRQKFAGLIVNEVFNRISEERFEVYEPVVQSVKQYFGVDE